MTLAADAPKADVPEDGVDASEADSTGAEGGGGRTVRAAAAVFALLLLISLFFPAAVVFRGAVLAILPVLVGAAIPLPWTLLRRSLLAVTLLFAASIWVGYILFALGAPLGAWLLPSVAALFIVVLRRFSVGQLVDRSDLPAIIVVAVTAVPFICGLVNYDNGRNLPILSNGEDAASHFAIFENIVAERGLVFGRSDLSPRLFPELIDYPQGSHFAAAAAYFVAVPHGADSVAARVAFFGAFQIALFLCLGALMSYVARDALHHRTTGEGSMVAALLVAFGTLGPLLFLMRLGFFSQLASYVLMLTLATLLAAPQGLRVIADRFALVIAPCVGAVWYFLSPVSFIFLAYSFLTSSGWRAVPVLAIAAGSEAFFVWPSVVGLKPLPYLNFSGAVEKIPVVAVITIALLGFSLRAPRARTMRALLTISICFTAVIAVYQLATAKTLSYYFDKSVYTIWIAALPLAAGCVIGLQRRRLPWKYALSAALLAVGLATVTEWRLVTRYAAGEIRFLTRSSYRALLSARDVHRRRERSTFVIAGDPVERLLLYRWTPAVAGTPILYGDPIYPLWDIHSYHADVFRRLREGSFGIRPLMVDPDQILFASCPREIFSLPRKQRPLIISSAPNAHREMNGVSCFSRSDFSENRDE